MNKRVKIGDVVEIPTSLGLAYAQYSHENRLCGQLIRILPGFHQVRPATFGPLVALKESFVVFFPLKAAVRRGIFQVVAHEDLPEHARPFPLFRAPGGMDPHTGHFLNWGLWDGEREWRVGSLAPEHLDLPIRRIWNNTLLVKRLEQGWTPVSGLP